MTYLTVNHVPEEQPFAVLYTEDGRASPPLSERRIIEILAMPGVLTKVSGSRLHTKYQVNRDLLPEDWQQSLI